MTTLTKSSITTEISEIFSSLQGEGPYLGKSQIFVRFGRCNMHCGYCDELEKMKKGNFSQLALENVLSQITELESTKGKHHSVSLTGGEPLMYTSFLKALLPELKTLGLKSYLETNGTLPQKLEEVLDEIDIIAMDLKPPSSTNDRSFWKEHEAFLKLAKNKDLFTKVVITQNVNVDEVMLCVDLVQKTNPQIPFVFQPESEMTGINIKALNRIEKEFYPLATAKLKDVRVIPQMHKVWGIK